MDKDLQKGFLVIGSVYQEVRWKQKEQAFAGGFCRGEHNTHVLHMLSYLILIMMKALPSPF